MEDGLYSFARTDAAGVTAIRFLGVARGKVRAVARLDVLVAPGHRAPRAGGAGPP